MRARIKISASAALEAEIEAVEKTEPANRN
jgi:hypothetical protein